MDESNTGQPSLLPAKWFVVREPFSENGACQSGTRLSADPISRSKMLSSVEERGEV